MYLGNIQGHLWHKLDESRYAIAEILGLQYTLLYQLVQIVSEVLFDILHILVEHLTKKAKEHITRLSSIIL